MTETHPTGPVSLPAGTTVSVASARRLTLLSPQPLEAGAVLEFDLLLGARPMAAMGRVRECRHAEGSSPYTVDVELLALAQVDRDSLADFLQAVGPAALRVRTHREE